MSGIGGGVLCVGGVFLFDVCFRYVSEARATVALTD